MTGRKGPVRHTAHPACEARFRIWYVENMVSMLQFKGLLRHVWSMIIFELLHTLSLELTYKILIACRPVQSPCFSFKD